MGFWLRIFHGVLVALILVAISPLAFAEGVDEPGRLRFADYKGQLVSGTIICHIEDVALLCVDAD